MGRVVIAGRMGWGLGDRGGGGVLEVWWGRGRSLILADRFRVRKVTVSVTMFVVQEV